MENTAQIDTKINTTITAESTQKSMEKSEKILEKNLHEKFALYGKNAREWTRKCALLLPEIIMREIWRKKGFSSIYEYAAKLAGMSKSSVDAALWTMQKTEDKPELRRVIEEKGITQVRLIANLATTETAGFWAEKAREMSSYTLAAYAKEFRKNENHACFESEIPITKQTQNISMELEPEVAEKLQKLKGQSEWNEIMQKLLAAYEENLEAKKPEVAENAKRYIPTKIKKYALGRTNSTCAFPGCTKPYEILHHTERFSLTHAHNPDQLTPLCKAHERLAHLGLIENEETASGKWRLRKWPDETEEKFKIDQKVLKFRSAFG